ncbi:avidin/streptavidin family protein [Reyranella sp.]|uniref:avidin/streptavidin family protein n=1 Tax=Reyranella sp. TaxID=1929291 RepID=UPI00120172E7|nr:avidin/streptavidin family protein [Reyranella sp.]TAJ83170.1 MAG: hypothetical protein EPO50_23010 [Reyranella sp.]
MIRLFACVAVLLSMSVAAQAQSGGREGTWVNDHGSQLVIRSIGPDGSISGTYANNSPSYECRGITFPIVGWLDGDMISYTAKWKSGASDCKSITSWTGYFRDGRLAVEWVLVYHDAAEGRPKVRAGQDSYRRS